MPKDWEKDVSKGGNVLDIFPSEFMEIIAVEGGKKVVKRVVPSLISRLNLNVGKMSETAAKVLTAPLGERPSELSKQIKKGLKDRKEFNLDRIDAIEGNIGKLGVRVKFR